MRRPGKTLCPPSSFGLAVVVVVVVVVVLISCRCLALSFSLLLLLLLLRRRRPRLPRGDVLVSERPAPKVSYAFHMR